MSIASPAGDGVKGGASAPVQQIVHRAYTVPEAAGIERELTAAWRAAASESVTQGGSPVARTSTGTVVALVGHDHDQDAVRATLMDATAAHPSRILLVVLDPEGDEKIEAHYSVFCQMPTAGRRHVCNEIIQIDAGGLGVQHVPPLVLGLLEPNLPVTVWATDRRQWELPQMASVFHVADRLLVDSEDEDALRALRAWQRARARFGARRVNVIDMAWQRLYPWRLICAELFDGLTERHDLASIDVVDIVLPPSDAATPRASGGASNAVPTPGEVQPHPAPSALLLAGWLASRLGWRVTGSPAPATVRLTRETADEDQPSRVSAAGADGRARQAQSTIDLNFRVADLLSCPAGWNVHSVSLSARAKRAAAYSVRVHPGGTALLASVGVADACPVPQSVPTRVLVKSELLCQALSPCPADRVFDEALARAVEIAAALKHLQPID